MLDLRFLVPYQDLDLDLCAMPCKSIKPIPIKSYKITRYFTPGGRCAHVTLGLQDPLAAGGDLGLAQPEARAVALRHVHGLAHLIHLGARDPGFRFRCSSNRVMVYRQCNLASQYGIRWCNK